MSQRESKLSRKIMAALRITELAWAAGFFDGEGTCYVAHSSLRPRPRLAIGQVDNFVLRRFQEAVGGLGQVNGPYTYNEKRPNAKPHYLYTCNGAKVNIVATLLWPYLSPIKRTQIEEVLHVTARI